MAERLENGETFPEIELQRLGGGTVRLPADLADHYGVILIYRGQWCPFCNEQIGAFAQAFDTVSKAGIKVVAFSADGEADAAAMAKKHSVPFALGHSADVKAIIEATGAYDSVHPKQGQFLESTGFILDPNGSVVTAVYSSRAIGRLVPNDVVRVVAFMRQQQKK